MFLSRCRGQVWGSRTPGLSRQAPGDTSSAELLVCSKQKDVKGAPWVWENNGFVAETAGRWLKDAPMAPQPNAVLKAQSPPVVTQEMDSPAL